MKIVQSYKNLTRTKLVIITSNKICKRYYPGSVVGPVKEVISATKTLFPRSFQCNTITKNIYQPDPRINRLRTIDRMDTRTPLVGFTGPRSLTSPLFPFLFRIRSQNRSINCESTPSEIKKMSTLVDAINKQKQKDHIDNNSSTASSVETSSSNDQGNIPVSKKTLVTLENINKKPYTTTINENSTSDEFTKEEMLEELKKRELIKTDDGKTAVTVIKKDDEFAIVGESKNKVKLSQVGQAYYEKFTKTKEIIQEQKNPLPKMETLANAKIGICIPPASTLETIVDVGMHKHLLLADDPKDKEYVIAYGYLTSKISGILMADKQFKTFQDKNQMSSPKKHEKAQQFVPYNPPRRIKVDEVKFVKYDQEYLDTVTEKQWKLIYNKIKEYWEKGIQNFPKDGITNEDALLICKEYDKIAAQAKGKHPITTDQAKINEENKKIQYQQQQSKKQEKSKNNENKPNNKDI